MQTRASLKTSLACLAFAAACLTATGPSRSLAAANASVAVTIKNDAFNPATVRIPAGSAVTFTNADDDPHTVTSVKPLFDSRGLAQGDSFRYVFRTPGKYEYYCKVHPFMRGTIIVTGARS